MKAVAVRATLPCMPVRAEWTLVLLLAVLAGCGGHAAPPTVAPVPPAELTLSLFLIGDAGNPRLAGDPVLRELARQGRAAPRASAIVFLGDNLYPAGMPAAGAPEREEMERRLDAQLDVVRESGLKTYFVPGNHDWARMGRDGWDAVRREEDFIRARGKGLASQSPGGGCPGPAVVDLGSSLRLLLIDTQWWLQKPGYPKPRDPGSTCPEHSETDVTTRLAKLLASTGGRFAIVAGHHPLATAGEHGGHFPVTTHVFPLRGLVKWLWLPLPVLGSIYPIARANGITSQDLSGGANERMRAALETAMAAHPPLLFAAGHEHALQVFRGPVAKYTIVSGAGIAEHEGAVGWNDNTLYASSQPGFMRLDVDRSGRVRLAVVEISKSGAREVAGIRLTER